MTVALAALAIFLGAALQSATGFGFALVSAPVLFALLGPQEAVTAGVLVALVPNALTLFGERRRPQVLGRETIALLLWSLPGLALGALALRELSDRVLSVLVAVAVLSGVALRARSRRGSARARARADADADADADAGAVAVAVAGVDAVAAAGAGADAGAGAGVDAGTGAGQRAWQLPATGLTSGALSTATSLNGPPLVFYLLARAAAPVQTRDTLATIFLTHAVLGVPALLISGTFVVPPGVAVLLLAAVAGQLLGRRAFGWLRGERYERAVYVVLVATALVALAASMA